MLTSAPKGRGCSQPVLPAATHASSGERPRGSHPSPRVGRRGDGHVLGISRAKWSEPRGLVPIPHQNLLSSGSGHVRAHLESESAHLTEKPMSSRRGHSFPHSFIPLFIQKIFTERLLSAGCCSKHRDAARNQTDRNHPRGRHSAGRTHRLRDRRGRSHSSSNQRERSREARRGSRQSEGQGPKETVRAGERQRCTKTGIEMRSQRQRDTESPRSGGQRGSDNRRICSVTGPGAGLSSSSCDLRCPKPVPSFPSVPRLPHL